ncbi:MAG: MerR family DNA-binding protein, partial [Ruminococcus sp.]|nr:MerR family DNA-binding protein [Ruminococcus sp.]
SIKEIKAFITMAQQGDSTLKERYELFSKRREALTEQIEELQKTLDLLNFKCWYYETAIKDGTEEKVGAMTAEEIPEEHRSAKEQLDLLHR